MPAELILWAQVSPTLRRAEPGGLHTTSYSINDILLALQKLVQLDRIKTWKLQYKASNYDLPNKISHVDYFIWIKKEIV